MSLYQKIKSAITVRQVGEMYGMEPDRHGMVCCPFHSDSDELLGMADRICVMCNGKLTGEIDQPEEMTQARVMGFATKF